MWRTLAASVTGNDHIKVGQGCDDAHALEVFGDGLVIAAVADGAGSYSGTSAWGSFTACREAVRSLAAQFDAESCRATPVEELVDALRKAVRQATAAVTNCAEEMQLPPVYLSTTLTLLIHSGDRAACAQVGDGIIVLGTEEGPEWVLAEEKDGYANVTTFLRDDLEPDDVQVIVRSGVDAWALSTDGLRYKVCDLAQRTPYAPFFEKLWHDLGTRDVADRQFADLLEKIPDDQTGDDKTMVVAARGDGPARYVCSDEPPTWVRAEQLNHGSPTAAETESSLGHGHESASSDTPETTGDSDVVA